MAAVDDAIKSWIKAAEKSGEIKTNRYVGKPFEFDDGYLETPVQLRMAFKVLKNGGWVPPGVEMLNQLADLKEALKTAQNEDDKHELRVAIANKQAQVNVLVAKYNKR